MNYTNKYENIPDSMKQRNNWIIWSKRKGKNGEFTKVPVSPNTLGNCAANDASNYQSFEFAIKQFEANQNKGISGIGFCLTGSEICIDLDHSLDQNKVPYPWASEILNLFPSSYIEVSQSGEGLHIFLYGNKFFEECKFDLLNGGRVEVYQKNRFIAMTGDLFQGTSSQLIDGSDGIEKLYAMRKTSQASLSRSEQVLKKMFASQNGHKIKQLFDGNTSDHGEDDSRADQALMNHLAFWTGKDSALMEELFNQSQLAKRDKWIQRSDYRERTIQKALHNTTNEYQGNIEDFNSSSIPLGELKPFPNPLKPVMEFDLDFLPSKLQPFVSDIAERLQCPIDFPAAALIVVLSSAIGRRLGIKPKQKDNWIVIPNLWGMVIGRPSIMKTPAMKQPMNLLEYHENERFKQYEEEKKEYERNKPVYEAIEQEKKNKIKNALKKGEDAFALVQDDSEAPPEPKVKRLITNDSTIEKLGELLSENEYGLLYFRDELYGFIVSFDKEGREADRAFYLEGWNGDGRFTVDRITRGTIFIEAICVSILGGIQPGKLQTLVKQAVSGQAGDDGLLQRFQIAVWPDDIQGWQNVDRYPNTTAREEAKEIVNSFLLLENGHSEAKEDKFNPVPFLSFDQEAQTLFNEWINEHENQLRKKDIHPAIEAHFGKYRSLIPSLALVFQMADDINSSVVAKLALVRAIAYSEYLKTHAIRIYESTSIGEMQAAKNLIRKIKRGEVQAPFTAREIQQKGWAGLNTPEMTKAVLELLEDLNYLRSKTKHGKGRPTNFYFTNPKLEINNNE